MGPSAKAIENYKKTKKMYSEFKGPGKKYFYENLEDYDDKRVWKWFELFDLIPCCSHCKGKDYTGYGSKYSDFESEYFDYILIQGHKCYNCKWYLCKSCYEEGPCYGPPEEGPGDESESENESEEEESKDPEICKMEPSEIAIENYDKYKKQYPNIKHKELKEYGEDVWDWFENHTDFPSCRHCGEYHGNEVLTRGYSCRWCDNIICRNCSWDDCPYKCESEELEN